MRVSVAFLARGVSLHSSVKGCCCVKPFSVRSTMDEFMSISCPTVGDFLGPKPSRSEAIEAIAAVVDRAVVPPRTRSIAEQRAFDYLHATAAGDNMTTAWRAYVPTAAEEPPPAAPIPRPSKKRELEDYKHLPLRKVDPVMFNVAAFPKMQAKPADSPYSRACKSRTANDRCEGRHDGNNIYVDETEMKDLPWDMRGPAGPKEGGPLFHMGQKFREGSQRWANPGGMFREMYAEYYALRRRGVVGRRLQYHHPMEKDGYWARLAKKEGELAPYEMKAMAAELELHRKQQKQQEEQQEQAEQTVQQSSSSTSSF